MTNNKKDFIIVDRYEGEKIGTVGGIELGGTKIVYVIGDGNGLIERLTIKIDKPDITLNVIKQYFKTKEIKDIGIATFGSVDLKAGIITTTPKLGWSGVNLKEEFKDRNVYLDTDVNGGLTSETQTRYFEPKKYNFLSLNCYGFMVYQMISSILHPNALARAKTVLTEALPRSFVPSSYCCRVLMFIPVF